MARLDSGGMAIASGPFSAVQCVGRVTALMDNQFRRKSIAYAVEIEPGLDVMTGDERKIKQVLLNLLGNAIKFTPEGGRVAVRVRREGKAVRFEVADTGVGIPAAECGRVFSEFYRLERDDASEIKGTGLGLALVSRLVALHGGAIGVVSDEGQGALFWFTIPQDAA